MLLEDGAITDPAFRVGNEGCTDGRVMVFAGLQDGRLPEDAAVHAGYSTRVQNPNACGLVTGIENPNSITRPGDSGGPVLNPAGDTLTGLIYAKAPGPLGPEVIEEHTGTTFPGSPMQDYHLAYVVPSADIAKVLAVAQGHFG